MPSDLQNKLYGTSVSKSSTGSVFIPISGTGIKMMVIQSNPDIDQITPASVICIVLQAIKSIAKSGAEWMKNILFYENTWKTVMNTSMIINYAPRP